MMFKEIVTYKDVGVVIVGFLVVSGGIAVIFKRIKKYKEKNYGKRTSYTFEKATGDKVVKKKRNTKTDNHKEAVKPKDTRGKAAQPKVISEEAAQPKVISEEAAQPKVTREDCWEKYREESYEKKLTSCYRKVFTETAIFYYLDRLFCIARYETGKGEWEKITGTILYHINEGLKEALLYRMKDSKGGYDGPSLEEFQPELEPDVYYYQRRLEDTGVTEYQQRVRKEYEKLERQIESHLQEKNTKFYRELWNGFRGDLEELLEYGGRLEQNRADMQMEQEFESLIETLREDIKKLGVDFIFEDEADQEQLERYFQSAEEGVNHTAVVRSADDYIYYFGSMHLQTETE